MFGIVERLPFIKTADRLIGGLLGFVEGVFVMGMILFVATHYDIGETYLYAIQQSAIAGWLMSIAGALNILLPKALQEVRPMLENL